MGVGQGGLVAREGLGGGGSCAAAGSIMAPRLVGGLTAPMMAGIDLLPLHAKRLTSDRTALQSSW